jgi:catabolite regulation protein CreA
MAVILGALAGAAALAMTSPQPVAVVSESTQTVAQRYGSSGVYGDISEIGDIIHQPGMIVAVIDDVDLSGVPCRWVKLRNGGIYRTYNMQGPIV